MTEPARIFDEPIALTVALDQLGLRADWLLASVEEGIGPVLACTLHDPRQLPGILGWGKITRAWRDRVIPLGHKRLTNMGQALTVDPTGSYGIVIAAGDRGTGRRNEHPSNRSPKGVATYRAIDENIRSFAEYEPDFGRFAKASKGAPRQTWFLLYFIDDELEEVRAELSLPKTIDDEGYVTEWETRILLQPPLTLPGKPAFMADDDDEGDDDIDVMRKQTG